MALRVRVQHPMCHGDGGGCEARLSAWILLIGTGESATCTIRCSRNLNSEFNHQQNGATLVDLSVLRIFADLLPSRHNQGRWHKGRTRAAAAPVVCDARTDLGEHARRVKPKRQYSASIQAGMRLGFRSSRLRRRPLVDTYADRIDLRKPSGTGRAIGLRDASQSEAARRRRREGESGLSSWRASFLLGAPEPKKLCVRQHGAELAT